MKKQKKDEHVTSIDELFSPGIKKLLDTKIGAYKLYDHFIAFFISYRMFEHDHRYANVLLATQNVLKKNRGVARYYHLLTYATKMLTARLPLMKKEVVFLSHYRPKADKDGTKKDYLFDDVLHSVAHRHNTALLVAQFTQDRYDDQICDNYNLTIDCCTILIFFHSLILSMLLYIKYLFVRQFVDKHYKRIFNLILAPKLLFLSCILSMSFERFLKKVDPRIIVVNDDVWFRTKPSDITAKQIIVQSALLFEDQEYYRGALYSQILPSERKADVYCVSGPSSKRLKERFFLEVNNVTVTGQPRFDYISGMKNKMREVRSSTHKMTTVLWATEFDALSNNEKQKNIAAFRYALTHLDNIHLIIKPHPAEVSGFEHYAELQKRFSNVEVRDPQEDIGPLLAKCDMLVIKNSTAGLDALLFDKCLIELNLSESPEIVDYVTNGVAIGVYNESDLRQAIYDLTCNQDLRDKIRENTEEYLYDTLYKQDAKASYRVADLIIQNLS